MFSIYTSAYNLNKMGFAWKETLENWVQFLYKTGEISIAVNTSDDNTYESLVTFANELTDKHALGIDWKIFKIDIPYSDPFFDGKLKTAALRQCTNRYCILLDMDEVIPLWSRDAWSYIANALEQDHSGIEALFIPTIDLFHDENNMKSIGQKWYLHLNLPYLERGPVNFAKREDGSIDITKSDTCELIVSSNSSLAKTSSILDPRFSDEIKLRHIKENQCPVVFHLGWLDKEQRIKQSAFWKDHWNNRDKSDSVKVLTMNNLDSISYKPHGLLPYRME